MADKHSHAKNRQDVLALGEAIKKKIQAFPSLSIGEVLSGFSCISMHIRPICGYAFEINAERAD
jgi:hypothetical protein